MALLALLLPILAPVVALSASMSGGPSTTAAPPRTPSARRRRPRVAAVVRADKRNACLGVVSALVDHVDCVLVAHDESDGARRRVADLTGDPSIDLVSVPRRHGARSRAQDLILERLLARQPVDVVLLVDTRVRGVGDLVPALLQALPGHHAVVAERTSAPASFLRRIGPRLRQVTRALSGRGAPGGRWPALLLTAETLTRLPLDLKRCARELRRQTIALQGIRVAWMQLPRPGDASRPISGRPESPPAGSPRATASGGEG